MIRYINSQKIQMINNKFWKNKKVLITGMLVLRGMAIGMDEFIRGKGIWLFNQSLTKKFF